MWASLGQRDKHLLMRYLTSIACAAGLQTFIAEVLPEITPMLQLFKTSGLHLRRAKSSM